MKNYLFLLVLVLLMACTADLEPIAVTRVGETTSNESVAQDEAAIYVINADGTGLQQLSDPADNKLIYNWSPDGQKIAFMWSPQGFIEIYMMDKDGSQVQQLTDLHGVTTAPVWSPDGRSLAFTSRSVDDYLDQGLYVVRADGSEVRRLTEGLQVGGPPQWSADGRFLLLTASRDETYNEYKTDIYLIAADGSGLQALTQTPGEEGSPLWSPEGQRIAFGTSEEMDQWQVWVMNKDGSGLVELAQMPGWGGLAGWSPDGRSLLFANNFVPGQHPDSYDIYTLDIESGTIHNLTDNPAGDNWPMWSPDGQRIAFTSDREGNEEVYVMAADGSNPTRLTFDNGRDWPAIWSPDGQQIAFNRSSSLVFDNDDVQVDVTTIILPTPEATSTPITLPVVTAVYPPVSLSQSTTFTDTKHGYTLQYPEGLYPAQNLGIESDSNFATQPNAEDLIALSQQDLWITIRVEDNPDGLSLDEWADQQLLPRGTRKLTVAGVPAWQGSGDLFESGNGHGGSAIVTYFTHNEQIFTVMGLTLNPDTLIFYTPIYQWLLNSFRFLPVDEAGALPSG